MSRIVFDTIRTPIGEPWPGFEVQFTVMPSTSTLTATYPTTTITAVTGEDGTFAVELEPGLTYVVGLATAFLVTGSSVQHPPGTRFTIVVPEGDHPIALGAIRALGNPIPPPEPTLLDAVVAAVAARLVPPGGQPGDALVKATEGDYALTWGTANAHFSSEDE